jgi:hypothetical protein
MVTARVDASEHLAVGQNGGSKERLTTSSGRRRRGQHAARTPTIAIPLAMMALVALLAYEF